MSRPYLVGAKRLTVGASTVAEFTAGSFETGFVLKKVGASGTLELTDGLSFGIGTGFELSTAERLFVGGPVRFFLAANGVTQTVSIAKVYSAGASGLPTLPPSAGLL